MGDPPGLATGGRYEDSKVLAEPLAFETFFETEARTLFRRLCIVTGNAAEAEEVVQDAFLALNRRTSYGWVGSPIDSRLLDANRRRRFRRSSSTAGAISRSDAT
jgi:DNA-directed RNA polymerase specialized sigma24 family protein